MLDSEEELRAPSPDQTRRSWEARQMMLRLINSGKSWSGHERNVCFLNTGGTRFATVSATTGLDFLDDGRALVRVDWDGDGDLDLWQSNRNAPRLRYLRNDSPAGNRSLSLALEGNGKTTSRDAIGARVEVAVRGGDGGRRIRTLRAGEGFLAQSSKRLHFAHGEAEGIEEVSVRWPAGELEVFRGLEPDGRYLLVQGSGRARLLDAPPPGAELQPGVPELPSPTAAARIPLVPRLRMPRVVYRPFGGGEERALPTGRGQAVWLNLWASWCAPCLEELGEITRRAGELRAASVEVVALAVDGVGEDDGDPAAAEERLRALGFRFPAGRATEEILSLCQNLHGWVVPVHRTLPLPTSFLIEPGGELAAIYTGRVSVDRVLDDLAFLAEGPDRARRFERTSELGGRAVRHPVVEALGRAADGRVLFEVAGLLWQAARKAEACLLYTSPSPRD